MSNLNVGRFVWYELLTPDPEAAKVFYSDVIGWKTEPLGDSSYTMGLSNQGPVAGFQKLSDEATKAGTPSSWIGSVEVADVDAAVRSVTAKGGNVLVPPTDVRDVGRFAVIADPQGAVISIVSSSKGVPSHDTNETGEVSWRELSTTDVERAFAFYSELFGWQRMQEFEMGPAGKYIVFGQQGQELGGMMKTPPNVPRPGWGYVITMVDFDDAIGRAEAKGGEVVNGPMDIPGGQQTVRLRDPQGATFALVTPRPKD